MLHCTAREKGLDIPLAELVSTPQKNLYKEVRSQIGRPYPSVLGPIYRPLEKSSALKGNSKVYLYFFQYLVFMFSHKYPIGL